MDRRIWADLGIYITLIADISRFKHLMQYVYAKPYIYIYNMYDSICIEFDRHAYVATVRW